MAQGAFSLDITGCPALSCAGKVRQDSPDVSLTSRTAWSSRNGKWMALLGLLLVVGTLVCYWPAGRLPFVL
jgi:hypothetical protein